MELLHLGHHRHILKLPMPRLLGSLPTESNSLPCGVLPFKASPSRRGLNSLLLVSSVQFQDRTNVLCNLKIGCTISRLKVVNGGAIKSSFSVPGRVSMLTPPALV